MKRTTLREAAEWVAFLIVAFGFVVAVSVVG